MRNIIRTSLLLLFIFLIFIEVSLSQEETPEAINKGFLLQDITLADEYINKGKTLFKTQFDSSYFYYGKAREIYEEVSKQIDQEKIWMNIILCSNMQGWILKDQGKYETSIQHFLFAIEIGLKKLGENHVWVASSYNNLGSVYSKKGNYDKALEYYIKSLDIVSEKSSLAPVSYNNIGTIYLDKGDYDRALEYLQKALSIRRQALEEENTEIARFYNNIGLVYKGKGDYDQALEFFQKSLSINLRLFGEENIFVADDFNNIGTVYSHKADYDQAIKYYEKSLSANLKILGENHQDVAGNYINIGIIYWRKGDYEKALEIHHKSLAILLGLFNEDNNTVAQNYMYIGNAYRDKGDYEQALEYIGKSLSIRQKLFGEKNPDVAESYLNIARVYERQNNFTLSLDYCQNSIVALVSQFNDKSIYANPSLAGINSESYLLHALKLKAKIFRTSGQNENSVQIAKSNYEMALSTYKLAVELIDKMRIGYKAEGSKLFLGEQVSEIYDEAIQTSLKLYEITNQEKYKEQAFIFAENSKATVLQEGLAEVQVIKFANLPSALLEEERQLKINLAFYETKLQNEYQKPVAAIPDELGKDFRDSIKISEYENHLFELKYRYANLISDFETNYPEYYDLKYQTSTISLHEIQKLLPDSTALIEYFVGDSLVFIFTVLKDDLDIQTVKKTNNFSQLIKDFYTSILKTETEKFINSSNELSRMLILPVINKISAVKNLVIIPHDLLYKIPFEALFTSLQEKDRNDYSKFNYLIKTFDISYQYASTLYINGLKEKAVKKVKMNEKSFIGFAPVFAGDDMTGYTLANNNIKTENSYTELDDELRSSFLAGDKFNELKYSKYEVESILQLLKSENNNLAYFFADATEEKFKSKANNFNIVHISSHSFINETHPQISGIVFAQTPDKSSDEDGILYSGETYNLDLNADLVVLSSCESGLGKLVKGEGMMALTRGFIYSGAANIIFSLWKVPDKITSELMIEFYTQMLTGKTYAESLRQAKLSLIKNETSVRPRSWASFVLIGSN